jgi:hypothetical protein
VSDAHDVRSQLVDPSLTDTVCPVSPSPDPCTVKLAVPVDPPFSILDTLTTAKSNDSATLTLPARAAALIDTRRLSITPDPAWHRIEVSDPHTDRSHAVWPKRLDPVYAARPSPAPCIVTLADPVEPAFPRSTTLAAVKSVDHAADTLPTRLPALTLMSRLPATPDPTLHRADVSDSHAVCSHIVPLDLAEAVYDACPTLDP